MTNNFTYFRKYIIFKPDYLSIPNINPRGHGKVEIKGARGSISVNIENSEVEKDYTISFLKDRQGRIEEFNVGRIFTNDRGRGRVDLPINVRELQGRGFGLEDINAILIRRDSNILFGDYIQEDTGVLNRFMKNILIREEKPSKYDTIEGIDGRSPEKTQPLGQQEAKEADQVEIDLKESRIEDKRSKTVGQDEIELDKEIKPETELEPDKEVKVDKEIESAMEPESEKEIELNKEVDLAKDVRTEEIRPEKAEVSDKVEEEKGLGQDIAKKPYAPQEYLERLNHKNQMISYILNILKFFPKLEPFKINLQGYSWWQIDVNGLDSHHGFLPYFNYLMGTEHKESYLGSGTTCLNQIEKYNHYLFGLYEEGGDTKYYVYGIPGQFTKADHPFSGETGFNIWFESIDQEGYWLLYINPMTGQVVYPLNPMLPAY